MISYHNHIVYIIHITYCAWYISQTQQYIIVIALSSYFLKNKMGKERKNYVTVSYLPTYLIFLCPSFLPVDLNYHLLEFHFSLTDLLTFFNIFCRVGVLATKSSILCLSGKVFILPFFLKDNFA